MVDAAGEAAATAAETVGEGIRAEVDPGGGLHIRIEPAVATTLGVYANQPQTPMKAKYFDGFPLMVPAARAFV